MRLTVLLAMAPVIYAADPGVSRELARQRAAAISNVRYDIALEIKEKAPGYASHAAIRFDLREAQDPLVLDFRDDSLSKLKVNGTDAESSQGNGHIVIPVRYLKTGANLVEIDFTMKVADAGRAATRFHDAQDGSEYVYTLFVPMD